MKHPDALRIALVGIGKIARDQHVPTIAARPDVQLVATVSRHGTVEGVPAYHTLEEAFAAQPQIEAVALCTPPVGRHALAAAALAAGRHVFLEKPPAATLAEIDDLRTVAQQAQRSLFTSWHSRCAAGVAPARAWLADKQILRAHITWKEDIRHWHPGQDWILEPGGMGVFDPGINALSIATHVLPRAFALREAELHTPANRQAPLYARLAFVDTAGVPVTAEFDFLQTGHQRWDIEVETTQGQLVLGEGGASLRIDGQVQALPASSEYDGLYQRFVELVRAGASEVDTTPFVHVADAFLLGARKVAAPFAW
ncbi:Gfo/Idh/MocA family protein [Xanthomonas melonis]|uniref:D-galactose 1-dehydrogenase n=1 Tax=Xanthomonas melonis TaxID=56456 RepID=A0A2S7DLQ1_9XANT|nr:Gfo/Idh/MocA family oxidoreductase [Xanthomonas melonis]MCC4598873.1 Gfo/Idh/MocA family oxidoreductase [Xanthomonas melonis]PPU74778.1 D-galactose 1-dehydrogenase [Xanthomonas melonis]